MRRVVVTGARGFVGMHLCLALRQVEGVEVFEHDLCDSPAALEASLVRCDAVFHLAGVNRPDRVEEFAAGNAGFTRDVLAILAHARRAPKVVLSSSIQADRENPYGRSKYDAEQELRRYCDATGAEGVIYRLKNLFGKWSRPNYNSVVATFCNNIAKDLPIQIADPATVVELTYIDDVVTAFAAEVDGHATQGVRVAEPLASHAISLGELAALLRKFRAYRVDGVLPDYSSHFVRALYATYLSYLPAQRFAYSLDIRSDARGSLAEFVKSPHAGQIFVSRTNPGVTRGNHYHHTKTEKFMVVEGDGIVRLRQIQGGDIVVFRVAGSDYRVVDIPPGYTHSIENVGSRDMVTLFWSSEVFDSARPDTIFDPVIKQ